MRGVRKAFVGVDGEGTTIGDQHYYNLLRAGDRTLENADGSPLSWWQCLNFLASLPPEYEYVSYFFDYDVTMILRGCREERVRRLLDREGRTTEGFSGPLPVDIDEFKIEYLPHKEFRVKRYGGPWVRISDTGTFFQSAFVTTLERWEVVDDWTLAKIMMGKEKRSIVTEIDNEVREYNGLEIEALERLMERFRDVCETIGYVPRLWQGPGNLATAMFRKHRIPKTDTLTNVPDEVWRWAQASYYGGRFETTAVGDIEGPVYQYDINSAYPWAITQLPCLVHGVWEKRDTRPADEFWVAYLGFGHGSRQLCNLPIRLDDGSIRYPQKGRGWYWSVEVLAAEKAGTTTYCDSGYWTLKKTCLCTEFSWVRTLYVMRVALGKTDRGMVLKLALNSLYGKTAQSIGSAPYGNAIYASLITAITRAALIDAYAQAPEQCYMLATDGLFMGQKLDLPINEHLGGWDLTTHDDGMFIIQPGLYFVSGAQYPKTRGVPMRKVMEREADFRNVWATRTGDIIPSITIPMRNFIGLRLATARNRYETAGQWLDNTKVVSFDWSTKRRPNSVYQDAVGLRTLPYAGKRDLITLPYSKLIGGNVIKDYERLLMEDQPDWGDIL